jgi:5'-3' exonuclease
MRLHLIDGTYELFRAHFTPRPGRTDREGRDVKATVGMVESMLALLADDEEAVTHVAAAFDNPIRSFRNDLFAEYKDESGVPEELLAQFDRAEDALRALGVVVWPMDEHEADDAIASAAARWKQDVEQVRLMTPDKDLAQCVEGTRVVLVDRRREKQTDEDGVVERYGIGPESIPDWLALVGDTADGIPGIPGFGAKTASAVLARYGHIESIPEDPDDWDVEVRGVARLAKTLAERSEDAMLYRRLATLVDDVPLPHELEDLRWGGVPRDVYTRWCEDLGVTRLLERPSRWSQ